MAGIDECVSVSLSSYLTDFDNLTYGLGDIKLDTVGSSKTIRSSKSVNFCHCAKTGDLVCCATFQLDGEE